MTDPTSVYSDIGDGVQRFIRRYCEGELGDLLEQYPTEKRSFWVNWADIHKWEPNVAEDYLEHYSTFKEVFEYAVEDVDIPLDIELTDITVRLYNLPEHTHVFDVGTYRAEDVGKYVGVQGQIGKTSSVKLDPEEIAYECQRCGTLTYIPQSVGSIQEPNQCDGCTRQGPFRQSGTHSTYRDYQLLQLQQPPEDVADGRGDTLKVVVTEELEKWLTERELDAGARVTVNGLLEIDESDGGDGTFGYYLDAQSIEVEEQDYDEIDVHEHKEAILELADDPDVYDKLVKSLAPDIQGGAKLRDIKLGILLQMFGGYRRQKPDGTTIRGDPHILLLGDPGTGKSSLLGAVAEISPRAMKTSGKGASAAGMTAAAVRDEFGDGQFSLEAGALALANKGVACVDEIDKMQDDAVESMHSALEEQVINVNKAGINASIPAQTALLAAGNPKYDRFDDYEPISEQIDLDAALLSRFDLWFMMRDEPDVERDTTIASGKVDVWQESAAVDKGQLNAEDAASISPAIPHDTLRAYIAYARRTIKPEISDAAGGKITEYYAGIRSEPDGDTVALTARKLEAIRRYSEASAKVRLSETVTEEDVQRALAIIGRSLADVGIDPETGEFDADIVETGTSKTQRDRIKSIKKLIEEMQQEHDEGVPVDDILTGAVEEFDIDRSKAEHELEKLRDKGEVYEPSHNTIRAT